jgi:diacylglycerol O-acyltransferase / wax synthase
MSYADHLVFGIIGDYDAAPDVDELANGIERAVIRLTSISAGHWRSTPTGPSHWCREVDHHVEAPRT